MLPAPFPIGYFIRNRMAAYLAYVALHSFVFTFQSTTLLKEWNGGDYSAFVKNPAAVDWSYGLVNLLIFAAGLGTPDADRQGKAGSSRVIRCLDHHEYVVLAERIAARHHLPPRASSAGRTASSRSCGSLICAAIDSAV